MGDRGDSTGVSEWILAMETCVPQASLVLARGAEVMARAGFVSERSQEVDLFEPLQKILGKLPAGEKLGQVLVGTGPGSYNGARVGIAAGQAVAQIHGAQVAGPCSFEGVVEMGSENVLAVGDARRGSFFTLLLEDGLVAGEVELLEAVDFQKKLMEFKGGLVSFEAVERLGLTKELAERVEVVVPTAECLLKNWFRRGEGERESLNGGLIEAFYLRAPHITRAKEK